MKAMKTQLYNGTKLSLVAFLVFLKMWKQVKKAPNMPGPLKE